jgi:hypothetical protein
MRLACACLTSIFVLFATAASAVADFPSCINLVNNPMLQPDAKGQYPADPALPVKANGTTKWSTDGVVINLQVGAQQPSQFIIQGVNYEPNQIGGSASIPPFNDLFYTNSVNTWGPLWDRDIEALRAMGVNSIRTYGVWKWEPGFANGAPPPHNRQPVQDGLADFWQLLDFTAATAEADNQFCDPDDPSIYAFKHPSHLPFLDKLWNNGVNPIYVWLGLAVPLDLVDPNVSADRKDNLRQFYRYIAKWLAKKYANHPAVIGFVIGNEIDTPGTTPTSDFWATLNDLDAVIKATTTDKLTAVTFHDTDDYNLLITTGSFANKRGPQVYQPNVWASIPTPTRSRRAICSPVSGTMW